MSSPETAKSAAARGSAEARTCGRPITLLVLWLVLILGGCAPDSGPELLEVTSVDPPALEAGTELRIEGGGFPEHSSGRLLLTGTLFVPGEEPRSVSLPARVQPQTRSLLTLRLTHRDLNEMLEGAAHGTFRGQAILSFDAKVEGRPSLRGRSEPLTLDFFARPAQSDEERGEAFARYLGLDVGDDWAVERLTENSIAARSGVLAGDRLLALDGVHLDTRADFVPTPRRRASELRVERQGGISRQHLALSVERSDFQLFESRLLGRVAAWSVAGCLILLWVARPPAWLLWWSSRSWGAAARALTSSRHWGRQSGAPAGSRGPAGPSSFFQEAAIFIVACTAFHLLLRLLPHETLGDAALPALLAGGLCSVVMSALLLGGRTDRGHSISLVGALLGAFGAAVALTPTFVGLLLRASELGTLRLDELTAAQEAAPWGWALLSSPWNALLAGCSFVALIPLAGRRPPLEGSSSPRDGLQRLVRGLEWSGTLQLLGLWVLTYCGAEPEGWSASSLWTGLLFAVKFALAARLLSFVRERSGWLRFGEVWSLWGRRNLALTGCALGLFWVAWWLDPRGQQHSLWAAATGCAGLTLAILALWSARRGWALVGRGSDPWI